MQSVDTMDVIHINSDAELESACAQWSAKPTLALDTEFMRTNTFYPKLGLLQVSDGATCYLIDPLRVENWQAFVDLLANDSITFILHSAGEDLILLLTSLGQMPVRLFDTQLAAAFLGMGFSLSYQALVKELLDKDVEKDETRSDWLRRPLSESQLNYAALDVRYLHELMLKLDNELLASEKQGWFIAECEQQLDIANNSESPALWKELYRSISNAWQLDRKGLTYLQRLGYWREQQARRKNKPRSWIVKDAELFIIASEMAKLEEPCLNRLQQLSGVPKGLLNRQGERLMSVLSQAVDDLPDGLEERLSPPLSIAQKGTIKAMQHLTREMAEGLKMAPELLARKRQILSVLADIEKSGSLVWNGDMSGWRKNLLQAPFEKIVSKA